MIDRSVCFEIWQVPGVWIIDTTNICKAERRDLVLRVQHESALIGWRLTLRNGHGSQHTKGTRRGRCAVLRNPIGTNPPEILGRLSMTQVAEEPIAVGPMHQIDSMEYVTIRDCDRADSLLLRVPPGL